MAGAEQKIPIPGGEGWAGMFSMIRTNLQSDKGYARIFHGNSYIQTIGWDEDGALADAGMIPMSSDERSNYKAAMKDLPVLVMGDLKK